LLEILIIGASRYRQI